MRKALHLKDHMPIGFILKGMREKNYQYRGWCQLCNQRNSKDAQDRVGKYE